MGHARMVVLAIAHWSSGSLVVLQVPRNSVIAVQAEAPFCDMELPASDYVCQVMHA